MPIIHPFEGKSPRIHDSAFIADTAVLIGDIEVGPETSIWDGCVLRADVNEMKIGARCNLQDGTVIHVSTYGPGTYLGDDVTIGHMALLHACTVETRGFVGMKACVMDEAVVESGAMLAAGALLPNGKRVPAGELWAGAPARLMRPLGKKDNDLIDWSAAHYVELAKRHVASR
ncbi:MAG: gamma carbonic anhydrase family protein [Alphaproteobacteria bacterium]